MNELKPCQRIMMENPQRVELGGTAYLCSGHGPCRLIIYGREVPPDYVTRRIAKACCGCDHYGLRPKEQHEHEKDARRCAYTSYSNICTASYERWNEIMIEGYKKWGVL